MPSKPRDPRPPQTFGPRSFRREAGTNILALGASSWVQYLRVSRLATTLFVPRDYGSRSVAVCNPPTLKDIQRMNISTVYLRVPLILFADCVCVCVCVCKLMFNGYCGFLMDISFFLCLFQQRILCNMSLPVCAQDLPHLLSSPSHFSFYFLAALPPFPQHLRYNNCVTLFYQLSRTPHIPWCVNRSETMRDQDQATQRCARRKHSRYPGWGYDTAVSLLLAALVGTNLSVTFGAETAQTMGRGSNKGGSCIWWIDCCRAWCRFFGYSYRRLSV